MLNKKALAGTAGAPKVYVEDVFSTYLYTGNSTTGGTQTITNNIDLSTKGGLVWIKGRSAASDNILTDTTRGAGASATNNNALSSNLTSAEDLGGSSYDYLSSFSTTGFVVTQGGTTTATRGTNYNNVTYCSWTFRKTEKFFDVVTYTGNGTTQAISHNLGSTPGCIIVKRTDASSAVGWFVYHRSLGASERIFLNLTDASANNAASNVWGNNTTTVNPTSTNFTIGNNSNINTNNGTYVAYLFAHDAGGFGLTGSDNVISCGSYTGNGANPGPDINLGYEAQWVLIKNASDAASWRCFDVMRGMPVGTGDAILQLNSSAAESTQDCIRPTATGFQLIGPDQAGGLAYNVSGNTYIYIAIRRGPMKTPTTGTSVFTPVIGTSSQSSPEYLAFNAGFPVDLSIIKDKSSTSNNFAGTRLTGKGISLYTNATNAEDTGTINTYDNQSGLGFTTSYDVSTWIGWLFRRAPGFFDVVCYTGTGSNTTISHNLGVVPELMIVKARNSASYDWGVFTTTTGAGNVLKLNLTDASTANTFYFNNTAPTSSVFSVGTSGATNGSGTTYVAYLFASVTGVSKVGSYTGNGSSVTVTTDFQPRFILVKRTDSTGNWIVSDSTRGLVAGNDPYLLLNSTAAEDTDEDWVDVTSTSFTVNQTTAANANVNTGTYIYLAIA